MRSLLVLSVLFLFFVLSLAFFAPVTLAENPNDQFHPDVLELNQINNEIKQQAGSSGEAVVSAESVSDLQLRLAIYNAANLISCTDPANCDPNSTALGNIAMGIGTMYAVPPASGIAYVRDLFAKAGLIKPVFAQGIGFAGLSPLVPLWRASRDISYIVIILVMISIGFMVIFRMKIDPKTVITVQAAIPKIVITLVLITLSYPIVGFMVDIMYLLMTIIISVMLNGMGQAARIPEVQSHFTTAGWPQLMGQVFHGGFSTLEDYLRANTVGYIAGGSVVAAVTMFATMMTGGWWALGLGVGGLGLLFIFILFLGLLFTFIRILLLLLNSYIQLIIGLVLAPIELLNEAIPGRSGFTQWLLNIMANLVVFPATAAILLFGQFLTQINTDTSEIFSPPFIGVPSKGAFPAFLGLGVLFLAPQLIAQIKKMFHPKPILPISAGTAFAPLTGGVQTAMGAASQFYYFQMSASQIPGLKNLVGGGKPGGH